MTLEEQLFLQTDPLRFSAGDVNIYRYCGNNPLNNSDPQGTIPKITVGDMVAGLFDLAVDEDIITATTILGVALGELIDPLGGGIPGSALGLLAGVAISYYLHEELKDIINNMLGPDEAAPLTDPTVGARGDGSGSGDPTVGNWGNGAGSGDPAAGNWAGSGSGDPTVGNWGDGSGSGDPTVGNWGGCSG